MDGLAYRLNVLALFGVGFILLFAFAWQFAFNELPCPLCYLQRAGFATCGIGFLLNVRFGVAPAHYGVAILSAIGGGFASVRQVFGHIAPGTGSYGSPFLGLHFYTWALIGFVAVIAFCAAMLLIDDSRDPIDQEREPATSLAKLSMLSFVFLIAADVVVGFAECGIGPCPDNPTGYWLFGTGKMKD
jgi:disulfide bond formation protein DsbB